LMRRTRNLSMAPSFCPKLFIGDIAGNRHRQSARELRLRRSRQKAVKAEEKTSWLDTACCHLPAAYLFGSWPSQALHSAVSRPHKDSSSVFPGGSRIDRWGGNLPELTHAASEIESFPEARELNRLKG
jgi:hypothetical protein